MQCVIVLGGKERILTNQHTIQQTAHAPGQAVTMVTSQPVFFGPHFPFEQPANDRAADWEIWLTQSAREQCASVCVHVSNYMSVL